jgi:hypothetical protein
MGRFFRWVRGIRAFERRDRGENPNHGGAQRTQRIDQELLIAEIAEKGCGVRGEDLTAGRRHLQRRRTRVSAPH